MRVTGSGIFSTLVALSIPLIISLCCGCGDDGNSRPGDISDDPLTFTRADGTVVEFSSETQTYIWCGPWEPGTTEVNTLHIFVGSQDPQAPGWRLRAVVDDFGLDDTLTFPNRFSGGNPDSVLIFLLDLPNECSTQTEAASGTIVFHNHPCANATGVDFTVDAVLGSEFGDLPPVTMSGRFTGTVTGIPTGR